MLQGWPGPRWACMRSVAVRAPTPARTDLLTAADRALHTEPSSGGEGPNRAAAALRSQVLAALARMHRHASLNPLNPQARAAAHEAVELAEAADDPTALALALLAAHDVSWEPGSARHRLPIIAAMADAAKRSGDHDLIAEAQLLRAAALIELGDPAGRTELARYTQMADGLGHARGRWGALSRRAMLAEVGGQRPDARRPVSGRKGAGADQLAHPAGHLDDE